MRSHPTLAPVVEQAAVALLCGWDPMSYLRQSGTERLIADAVLERCAAQRVEEMSRQAEAIGAHVASTVARMLSP